MSATPGVPLEPGFRSAAEARLGVTLADVRLTATGALTERARARGADAAVAGNTVAFSGGLPDLRSPSGRFALGHELGHIARHRGGTTLAAGDEAHADAVGRALGGPRRASGIAEGVAHPSPERLDAQKVHFGIFDPVRDFLAEPVGYALAAAPGVNAAHARVVAALPRSLLRFLLEVRDGAQAADRWTADLVRILLVHGHSSQQLFDHLIRGLQDGSLLAGQVLGAAIDVLGIDEFARSLFVTSGALSPLDPTEETASRHVHPPGLIPYAQVLVDRGGIGARLAAIQGSGAPILNQLVGGPGAVFRSVTTMHVIHTGTGTMSAGLAVHELTHVGQYTMAGAKYMAQALHAQLAGQGYDYNRLDGSLAASIAAGRGFSDFNREQQAQICEDYYDARFGGTPRYGGALSDLEHFVRDLWRLRGAAWPAGGP
ncbi:DUF4157 domain-containing protein [Pararhodobacter sp. SW119]|uniref:eCIS core domain-containing protein n=1 Tax=Pararhodobacter sp. SW119 TaxID=2780075 RepID=UPI001ADFD756